MSGSVGETREGGHEGGREGGECARAPDRQLAPVGYLLDN